MEPQKAVLEDPEASEVVASLVSLRESPASPSSTTSSVGESQAPQKEAEKSCELFSMPEEGNYYIYIITHMIIFFSRHNLNPCLSQNCFFFTCSGDDPKVHPSQAADAEAEQLSAEEDSDVTGAEEQVLKKTHEKRMQDETQRSSAFTQAIPRPSVSW